MSEVIKSYKGFDKDLKCRDFQYEVGKEYEEEAAEACKSGFHACTMPLDVFKYYPPAGSRFCQVEQSGKISKGDDTKVASSKIKIGAEIGIAGLVKAQIEWVKEKTEYEAAIKKADNSPDEHATGYQGAASATGDQGAASATGYQGAASATGRYGAASATGGYGAASATGESSVAMVAGLEGKVKGSIGCALFAVERGDWNGSVFPIISVAAGIVDGQNIKEDTWYIAKNGVLVEI
jgi:hypothetical protein